MSASQAEKVSVEIRPHRGRPAVFIDGEPHPLAGYNYHPDHVGLFSEHKMGVYLIGPTSNPNDYRGTRFWVGDEVSSEPLVEYPPKTLTLDHRAEQVLDLDPDAYLMVRFVTREPRSWREKHPVEYFITEEGELLDRPSLAGDLFWEMAAKYSAALIQYVESRPWAHRVVGYANFHYEEGVHRPVAEGWYFDHNPAMLYQWRRFLEARYGTEEALREAYGDPELSFETAEVPRDKLRGTVPEFTQIPYWQAGADNRELRD